MDSDVDCYFHDDSILDDPEKKSYKILSESDIRNVQEEDIANVCSLFSVSKASACILLCHYKWNVESLLESWFADEERVRRDAGLAQIGLQTSISDSIEFTCGICFDVFPAHDKIIKSCDHMYCTTCLGTYISIAIDEGSGCLSLRCPDPLCNAPFGEDMVNLLVSEEHKKKFYQYFVRSYVEGNSNIKWCPAPDCGAAIEYIGDDGKSGGYEVVCNCSFKFCWRCIEDDHRPVDCDTVAKWEQKTKCEAHNVDWILVNTKPCPKCKRPIEKNRGCMHMTCNSSCGHQFCWTCLGPLDRRSIHKCNTYKSEQDDETKKAESSLKRNAKALLKRYAHYFERWDANHKSRTKAQSDLEKMQETNLQILCEKFGLTKLRLKFVIEAWKQIIECRRTLKWSYAYGYFIPNHERAKIALFEYLQGQAEAGLERLHQCAEEELMEFVKYCDTTADQFDIFRAKLVHLTSVTRDYFANLVTALENDLVESENKGKPKRKNRTNEKEKGEKQTEKRRKGARATQ